MDFGNKSIQGIESDAVTFRIFPVRYILEQRLRDIFV